MKTAAGACINRSGCNCILTGNASPVFRCHHLQQDRKLHRQNDRQKDRERCLSRHNGFISDPGFSSVSRLLRDVPDDHAVMDLVPLLAQYAAQNPTKFWSPKHERKAERSAASY